MPISYELLRNIEWFKYMSLNDSLSITIVGLVVTFIGLIILVLMFYLMGAIFKSLNKSSEEKEEKKTVKAEKKNTDRKIVGTAPAPVVEAGIDDEVVAVIAAAIASMTDGETRYAVRSIKKVRNAGVRPVWAMAGIRENTTSF